MKLIEEVDKIVINDKNKYFLEDIINKYLEYMKFIEQFDERLLKHYLGTIKQNEILNNQQAELESSLLISIYNNMYRENSLDKIIRILNEKDDLTKQELKCLHRVLMRGTTSEANAHEFRKDDNKFVGSYNPDGSKRVDYMPIPFVEIDSSIEQVVEMINSKNVDNPFINPFIIHAIISVMQPFDDGNTRLSRLVQHAKIWKNTNLLFGKNFDKPLIYLSKNYLISRGNYRGLLANLAKEENNEAWNKWFEYNLNMVDEQLFYLDGNVKRLVR